MYDDFTLLVDGKEAFPEIINCIKNAKESIKINMFIWRDDNIGNLMGQSILDAANRGVKIYISIDRYGVVLEKSEESKKSFFHKKITLNEKIKIKALEFLYPMKGAPKKGIDMESILYKNIMNHPNIEVSKDIFKADHSKYYIIDNKILFMGGINIEDKENGMDMQNRVYQDYMVKIEGKEYVDSLILKLEEGKNYSNDYFFGVNSKDCIPFNFEMEKLYLDMINNTKKDLIITMAYFSSLKKFNKAIINAYKRGVNIKILIPSKANYQGDTNRKTVKKLMKKTNNNITLYFSPKMVHTKMIITDEYISFGSTNITKKAFNQLSELNLFVKNVDSKFRKDLFSSIEENYELSIRINHYKKIKYNKLLSFLEGFLV